MEEGSETNLGTAIKFRSYYLSAISGTSPIYDELWAFFNFITTCNSGDSRLIRFVIWHAIYCARVQSPVGRNYVLCYERYGSKVEDEFIRLVSHLRAVVTTFPWSCLLSTAVLLQLLN